MDLFRIFSDNTFMPHGHCYLWSPAILWGHVVSDGVIALSYFSIPVALVHFIRKRDDLVFSWMFFCFALFILACGLGHLIDVYNVWNAEYGLSAIVRIITAAVSVVTAVLLWPLIPVAMEIPSAQQLKKEIDEKNRVQDELIAAKASLEEQVSQRTRELQFRNEEMKQLIYTVSHDLKSPLVTVQGFSGIVLESLKNHDVADALESAERVRRATDVMAAQLDDLLEFSRVGGGENLVELLDVHELVVRVRNALEAQFESADAQLEFEGELPQVYAVRNMMFRIFQNLIGNALKYGASAEQSVVKIGYRESETHHQFYVKDNGIGIPREYQRKIFELFRRLNSDRDGSGLGLAIVLKAARALDGSAWVESEPGEGARFWFSVSKSMKPRPSSEAEKGV